MEKNFLARKTFTLLAAVATTLFSAGSSAENLIETYQLAIKNDPAWASKKAKFLADREGVDQAFGSLLPQASLTLSYADQEYEGSSLDLDSIFDDNDVSRCRDFTLAGNALTSGQGLDELPPDAALGLFGCTGMLVSLNNIGSATRTQSYTVEQIGVTVSQPLFRMDRWYRYQQAKKLENSAQANLAYSQQDLPKNKA